MAATFKVLSKINPKNNGRRIAILGDMRELGNDSAKYHADLVQPFIQAGFDQLYCCGPFMQSLYDGLSSKLQGVHAENSTELAKIITKYIQPNDVILVKGSLGSKMIIVIEALRGMINK
jgi:UDP-N-acetylmuramoyl-tripeptide--D-alanyl-D-alanine ligase